MSGIGALLEQEDEDGWQLVAFTSRKWRPAEENHPVHDLELMAIVYALHEWRVCGRAAKHTTNRAGISIKTGRICTVKKWD
jgi:RNase H-like domain found in reverse transcriptase